MFILPAGVVCRNRYFLGMFTGRVNLAGQARSGRVGSGRVGWGRGTVNKPDLREFENLWTRLTPTQPDP